MERSEIEKLSKGDIGAVQEKLWNPAGTWPQDFNDPKQNPHGRPWDYWCPTVGGQTVGWEGVSGWPTKGKALEIAGKFRDKCHEWLSKNSE